MFYLSFQKSKLIYTLRFPTLIMCWLFDHCIWSYEVAGNSANTAGRTSTHQHTHTHTHTYTHTYTQIHIVPSSLSSEPFSDFHLSFFFSGLLFLLSFPFSFTPFCFLFSPFWGFSAGRHRTWARVKDLVDLFNLSLFCWKSVTEPVTLLPFVDNFRRKSSRQ